MHRNSIDEIDRTILSGLYNDCTRDLTELSDKVGIEKGRLDDRIERLEESGIITQFTAIPDPGKMGFPIPSYHFMSLAQNYDEAMKVGMPFFQAFGGSELAMVVLGEYDLILRKLSESDARLNNFMNNLINDPEYPQYETSETYRVTERLRWRGFDVPAEDRYEVEKVELDERERKTLQILRRNGRLRTKPDEIARRIETSPEDALDAVDRLEDEVILGYSIDIDFEQLGWNRAFLGLSSLQGEYEHVIESVREMNSINVPYIVSGSGFNWAHIGIEIVFESIEELDELTDEIRTAGGARETRTFLSTKTLIDDNISIN